MKTEACRRCIESAQAAGEIVAFLNDQPVKCKTCANASVMCAVSEQFKMRTPKWWVANGVVVVPIWIVELIKQHHPIFGSDDDQQTKSPNQAAGRDTG